MTLTAKKNNFDGIRLVAALMVIFSHSFLLNGLTYLSDEPLGKLTETNDFGHLGVSIFLFISGYLISNSLMKNTNSYLFFKKRVLRMLPALFVVILISMFVIGPYFTNLSLEEYFTSKDLYIYLKNIILFRAQYKLPGVFESCPISGIVNGSLWTLAYEFLFYGVLFSLYKLIKRTNIILIVSILIFVFSIFILMKYRSEILRHQFVIPFFQLSVFHTLDLFIYFILGVIFSHIHIKDSLRQVFFVLGIVLFSLSIFKWPLYNNLVFYFAIPFIIYSIAFSSRLKLNQKGDFSYGIYLNGFIIQQILVQILGPNSLNVYLFFLISAFISILLGFISWKFIEKPALKFKN